MTELNFEELKAFLKERKIATIYDFAFRFEAQIDVLRDMLNILAGKGVISKRMSSSEDRCTSCRPCGSTCGSSCASSVEIYEWIEKGEEKK